MNLRHEPAAIAAAVQAVFGALIALGVLHLTDQQIGAIMIALTTVLGLFVRQSVVPVSLARERMAAGNDPLTPRD